MSTGDVLALIGVLVAVAGLIYAGRQLRDAKHSARGEFILALDGRFDQHAVTHGRLRPGGDWSDGNKGPTSAADWVSVESYMGLFERVDILVREGLISLSMVDDLYGYRLVNIVKNKVILNEKLKKRPDGWRLFIHLWNELTNIENGYVAKHAPCDVPVQNSVEKIGERDEARRAL
jgi:hypothetical protein